MSSKDMFGRSRRAVELRDFPYHRGPAHVVRSAGPTTFLVMASVAAVVLVITVAVAASLLPSGLALLKTHTESASLLIAVLCAAMIGMVAGLLQMARRAYNLHAIAEFSSDGLRVSEPDTDQEILRLYPHEIAEVQLVGDTDYLKLPEWSSVLVKTQEGTVYAVDFEPTMRGRHVVTWWDR